MDYKSYSGMIFKVLDFLGGFWIIYWLFMVISAVSYDPQMLVYMLFSFLIYTFPAIIYLVFRKRIKSKINLRLSEIDSPEAAEKGEYYMGYKEIKEEAEPAEIRGRLGLILAVIFITAVLFLISLLLLR
ncbi:MAG: hypothetical protein H6Q58_100 [Firmicutes bacterium]|nr:hypothetical protein [Bacillota bacterium]